MYHVLLAFRNYLVALAATNLAANIMVLTNPNVMHLMDRLDPASPIAETDPLVAMELFGNGVCLIERIIAENPPNHPEHDQADAQDDILCICGKHTANAADPIYDELVECEMCGKSYVRTTHGLGPRVCSEECAQLL